MTMIEKARQNRRIAVAGVQARQAAAFSRALALSRAAHRG